MSEPIQEATHFKLIRFRTDELLINNSELYVSEENARADGRKWKSESPGVNWCVLQRITTTTTIEELPV